MASTWELRDADLQTFQALDQPSRHLILRLLDEPSSADFADLAAQPNGAMLANWLLALPAYVGAN